MTGPNRLAATISKIELSDSPSRRAALVNGDGLAANRIYVDVSVAPGRSVPVAKVNSGNAHSRLQCGQMN
jgi:hypothetical protein